MAPVVATHTAIARSSSSNQRMDTYQKEYGQCGCVSRECAWAQASRQRCTARVQRGTKKEACPRSDWLANIFPSVTNGAFLPLRPVLLPSLAPVFAEQATATEYQRSYASTASAGAPFKPLPRGAQKRDAMQGRLAATLAPPAGIPTGLRPEDRLAKAQQFWELRETGRKVRRGVVLWFGNP